MLPSQSTLFLFLFLLFFLNYIQPNSANTELRALMEIKTALDPENKYLSTWSSNGDPCSGTFEGVACNVHRKVANISLQGRGLKGRLSPAIAGLKCLSGLYLHYNSLTGEIPREICNLTQLNDLYLDVNNLTGSIPPEIGNMESLQVLQLCCNQLQGAIPSQMGSLKKLTVLAMQHNQLTASIPPTLGQLQMLTRLDLSYNHLSGSIPISIANIPQLQVLDVRNNTLSGAVPSVLKKLGGAFSYQNNLGLCGQGFDAMRACASYDNANINTPLPFQTINSRNHTTNNNNTSSDQNIPPDSNTSGVQTRSGCSNSSKLTRIILVVGVLTATATITAAGFLTFVKYRRKKHKIGSGGTETSVDGRLSTDQANYDLYSKSASPLVSLAYSTGWDPLADGLILNSGDFSQEVLQNYRFTMEDVESATQYFNEGNVLGRGNFSIVYKGLLRDGSTVAIKSINVRSCKPEESDFVKGISLLTSLRHENLVNLRGFCCSRGRGECFLVYDFVPNGNLSRYLDVGKEGGNQEEILLDWSTRVSIVNGIAKGIHYLHEENHNKPAVIHQNISADKILFDRHFNPLISDPGLRKILADDIIFSALKVSAAMGYLAPEYITTGRFTELSDVYAFGVIVLQILSGKHKLTCLMRSEAELLKPEEFVDEKLKGRFSVSEATKLARLAVACTNEIPSQRPTMEAVMLELHARNSTGT